MWAMQQAFDLLSAALLQFTGYTHTPCVAFMQNAGEYTPVGNPCSGVPASAGSVAVTTGRPNPGTSPSRAPAIT